MVQKRTIRIFFKTIYYALAGVAQWIECQPANQRATSSIPCLRHMAGLRARSPVGGAQAATTHLVFPFLPLFLPLFPFLKLNK